MKPYRIVEREHEFKVQRRWLWFFWTDLIVCTGWRSVPALFTSRRGAQAWITTLELTDRWRKSKETP